MSDPVPGRSAPPLLELRNLRKYFPLKSRDSAGRPEVVRAVDDVSFTVYPGETLAVVGESGCGKSTTASLMLKLLEADSGGIYLDGEPVVGKSGAGMRRYRQTVQMVFQDSYSSLNPRMTLEDAISFGLKANGVGRREASARARLALDQVGLNSDLFSQRFPHELSGGQRQRVNIARALAMRPRLVVLDEAVSALDKSVEAQVLNLLAGLKQDLGLTYVFISHDLNVVEHIADRVAVMYLGRVVEMASVDELFASPRHPYTQGLLKSRLSMNPDLRIKVAPLAGDPPNPINPGPGCRFRPRCPLAVAACAQVDPGLAAMHAGKNHEVACHVSLAMDAR